MIAFVVTMVVCFVVYLILTAGSGEIGFWSIEEIIFGIIISHQITKPLNNLKRGIKKLADNNYKFKIVCKL